MIHYFCNSKIGFWVFWLFTTIITSAIGYSMIGIFYNKLYEKEIYNLYALANLISALLFGLFVGGGQALVLKSKMKSASIWIIYSILLAGSIFLVINDLHSFVYIPLIFPSYVTPTYDFTWIGISSIMYGLVVGWMYWNFIDESSKARYFIWFCLVTIASAVLAVTQAFLFSQAWWNELPSPILGSTIIGIVDGFLMSIFVGIAATIAIFHHQKTKVIKEDY